MMIGQPLLLSAYEDAWKNVQHARKALFEGWKRLNTADGFYEAKRLQDILGQMAILSSVALVIAHWLDDERYKIEMKGKSK